VLAPHCTACEIGALLITPPSTWGRPSIITGGNGVDRRSTRQQCLRSRVDVGSHDSNGDWEVFKILKLEVPFDQSTQRVRRDEVVASAQETTDTGERAARKHVTALHVSPDIGESTRTVEARSTGHPRCVDCPNRRAHDVVRRHTVLGERHEHANLDGAETSTT
jgi:hypothetical protein